eukprot:3686933-Rhodomonas_salina.1
MEPKDVLKVKPSRFCCTDCLAVVGVQLAWDKSCYPHLVIDDSEKKVISILADQQWSHEIKSHIEERQFRKGNWLERSFASAIPLLVDLTAVARSHEANYISVHSRPVVGFRQAVVRFLHT